MHVTLAKGGVAFHRGAAKIHGHYMCKNADLFAGIEARLMQRAGRLKIQGDGGTRVTCDGVRHGWSARIVSPWGTYAKGFAQAKASIFACGFVECSQTTAKRRVHLGWASGSAKWMKRPTTGLTLTRPTWSTHWPTS